ncbi:hypothetical protein ABZ470_39550 [Streptosporangium sp. NPDC020072]|uniref:hypothetical protein n=1 Tax=Streptosporangium sp. NPDC020072 TaxID=3154788 RepID=UPI0034468087
MVAVPQWRITQVREVTGPGEDAWLISYEPASGHPGEAFVSYVPKEALVVRAAEYGLATVDEALEVILHEPLLAEHQAAGRLEMLTPALLDVAAARAQVEGQLAVCREQYGVVVTAAPAKAGRSAARAAADPLQVIRDRTRIDPIETAAIRMEIDRVRLRQET